MKVCALLLAAVACAVAEPPVSRSYLPPSNQYGAPAPDMQFGARTPSAQYGVPALGAGAASAAFGRSSAGSAGRISSSFGSASSRRFGAGRRFGSAAGRGLSTQYGAPSAGAGFGGSGLSSQYGVPSFSNGAPSAQYGAPSVDAGFGRSAAPSPVYGVPGYGYSRAGAQEDALAEPANYEFSYSVEDANTLSDFAHEESRQDESAQGQYRVLLPDGRKQIVSYQADENGYMPTIEYEETGLTANSAGGYGYGRGRAEAGNGGYHY